MSNIILQKKLLFIHHLANLPKDSLVLAIQMNHNMSGLLSENELHLNKLNFSSSVNLNKWQFKKLVKDDVLSKQ